MTIDLEEPAQRGPVVTAAESIGTERHESLTDVRTYELRVRRDVISRRHDRMRSLQTTLHVRDSRSSRRVQPIVALDVAGLSRELAETRDTPHLARDAPLAS